MCGQRGQRSGPFHRRSGKRGPPKVRRWRSELVRLARSAGMRLIGPNGMGLYCPKSGLSFFPRRFREPGPVGIVSHSGSLTNILGRMASRRGIRFSKVISSGNEYDLTAADCLTYLGRDPETGLIGGYIEGIKDGLYFLRALKEASPQTGYSLEGGVSAGRFAGLSLPHGRLGRVPKGLAGRGTSNRGDSSDGV